jgi:hypothetical protein
MISLTMWLLVGVQYAQKKSDSILGKIAQETMQMQRMTHMKHQNSLTS